MENISTGANGITTGAQYQDLLNRSMQPGAASTYLTDIAGGSGLENPYFQQQLQNQLGNVSDMVNRSVSGQGRYGSGAHTGVLSRQLGEASTSALASEWNRARQEQMGAIGSLEAAEQARLGLQGGALQGMTGVQAQNVANQLAGSQGWFGAQQSAPWSDLGKYGALATGIGSMGGQSQTNSKESSGSTTGLLPMVLSFL